MTIVALTIDDASDDRLDPIRDLPSATDPRVIIEGEVALSRALAAGWPVEGIACTPGRLGRFETLAPSIPRVVATRSALAGAMGFDFHRGCVGWSDRPPPVLEPPPALVDLVRRAWQDSPEAPVLVAEGLADPSNLGALARNARAFYAPMLICDQRGADPWSRRSVRASMGNVFALPTVVAPDPVGFARKLADLTGAELWAAALVPDAIDARQLPERAGSGRILMLGNEGRGLSPQALAQSDHRVRIDVAVDADSLNVAAAAAVLLYAFTTLA